MKQSLKRILAVVLTVLMLLPAAFLFADAATTLDLPIVYVAGKYGNLYTKDNKTKLYPLNPSLGDTFKDHASELVSAYTASNSTGNWKTFADKIYDIVYSRFEPLIMDNSGNPRNGTHVLALASPKKKTSNFQLEDYMFTYDGRVDPYENAKLLKNYIDAVLAATGKSKVNLIGRCLGTTVMATYLTVYGASKVESSIFFASAFNGVYMMDGFFSADFDIDYGMVQYYLAYGKDDEGGEFDTIYEIANIFQTLGLLGVGVNKVNQVLEKMSPYLFPRLILAIFGTWPGHWAMISSGAYEKAKSVTFQDAATYAALIKKTDKYQINVMSKFPATLEKLRKEGMRVAIVCKYNTPLMPLSPHSDMQADGTVELKTMSLGATAADIGKTFSNAYITVAKRAGHGDYLSKDLVVDAYTCQYPDYTWFIKNCPHGEYPPEINTMFMEIFHSSKQYTIETNSKFPQFVSYDTNTKKISPITQPDSGADTSGGLSSNFFSKIADWIRSFLSKILSVFGGLTTA